MYAKIIGNIFLYTILGFYFEKQNSVTFLHRKNKLSKLTDTIHIFFNLE